MVRKRILGTILAILVLYLIVASLTWAQPSISTPEFTVAFAGEPYYISPTTITTTDTYTGNVTLTQQEGQYRVNGSINLSIKKQSFDSQNGSYSLYYSVELKGHYKNWASYTYVDHFVLDDDGHGNLQGYDPSGVYLPKSTQTIDGSTSRSYSAQDYPQNAQIDFRVRALVYAKSTVFIDTSPNPHGQHGYYETTYDLVAMSDLTSVQTVIIPQANTTDISPPSLLPSPSVPEFPNWVILPLAAVAATMLVYFRRKWML
jgi:hypothetical protein